MKNINRILEKILDLSLIAGVILFLVTLAAQVSML